MSVNKSLINQQSVEINQLLVPQGVSLSGVANMTPIAGSVSYSAGILYYGNGSTWTALGTGSGGPVSLSAFGSTPNANGMSLTSQVLNMQPASASFPGGVSTLAQAFLGVKTFSSGIVLSNLGTGIVHSSSTGTLTSSTIVNADVSATAAIVDTKLATISTAGKVSNTATTATNNNTASTIMARDASGNFNANSVTLSANCVINGILTLPSTASATVGVITFGGNRFMHTKGGIMLGQNSCNFTNTVSDCVGVGIQTLASVTVSSDFNVAIGAYSMIALTNLSPANTAVGTASLGGATSGCQNNVAIGNGAIPAALVSSSFNTGLGANCLALLTSGSRNISIGYSSGGVLVTGSDNIFIGINATTSTDSNTCKIGKIYGTTTASATTAAVVIDLNGQLGTIPSVRSAKMNIIDVNSDSNHEAIMKLRPKRFDLRKCPGKYQQYGLIYDECPEDLLIDDAQGEPMSVAYQYLPTINLTQIQRLTLKIEELEKRLLNAGL